MCLQAYAPLSAERAGRQLVDRFLLVFGCSQPGCGSAAAAWRALRCQREASPLRPAAGSADGMEAISTSPDAQPLATQTALPPSEWGGTQDDWGSGFDAPLQPNGGAPAAFQFADLDAALEMVSSKSHPAGSASSTQQPVAAPAGGQVSEEPHVNSTSCTGAGGPELPAFYLHAAPEPARAADQRLRPEHAAHVAELLRRYKEEEGQVTGSSPIGDPKCHQSLGSILEVPLLLACDGGLLQHCALTSSEAVLRTKC